MQKFILPLILSLLSTELKAAESLYESLSKLDMLKAGFEVKKMASGIDLMSKDTFKNSKGVAESLTHMELEGPINAPNIKTLEQGLDFLVDLVQPEVDESFTGENNVIPGLDAVIVDVNGTKVGLLDYKVNHEPDTYITRAMFLTSKGLYS